MILVVSKSKSEAEKLAESFNIMGYLSLGVAGASAKDELTPSYHAIIVINPITIPSLDSLLYYNSIGLKVPIFAIGDVEDGRFSEIYTQPVGTSILIKRIIRYLVINEKPIIGKYKCAGFDASAILPNIQFFDRPIKLTKTEKMIFRYLSVSYPLPVTADQIIKYAIRPSRNPEPSSIRTHISGMNKKFKDIIGRPMIDFFDRRGYLLITPDPRRGNIR